MPRQSTTDPARGGRPRGRGASRRALVGALCAVQAVALAGVGGWGLASLPAARAGEPPRIVGSAVFALAAAVAAALLARGWFSGARWQRSATVVWGVLLVPVGLGLGEGSEGTSAGVVVLVGVVTAVAALAAGSGGPDEPSS